MPRPPLGEKAMTDVERQRKRRERLLKERDAELDAAASASDDPRLAAALRENVRLRQRLRDKRQELESLNGLTRQQRRTTKNSFARGKKLPDA
jgi:hypothetical protein